MDSLQAYELALEKRKELQQKAQDMGITEAYISCLVETFYEKVRTHTELGPVFNEVIGDRWPYHLTKMKSFWSSLALRTGTYQGRPMQAHKALTNAEPEHFKIWLNLFEETLRETAPSPAAVEYFLNFAETIAGRLQRVMFG